MIEQIKQDLPKCDEHIRLNTGNGLQPTAQKLLDAVRYLIGEAELSRELYEAERAINGTIGVEREMWAKEKLELQKALEDQKLRMQYGYKNGYESETVFWIRCIWEIDQTLERMKP